MYIRIESRNIDGLRVVHEYEDATEMLQDWNSDDPSMGDNEILLCVADNLVLYSSLGLKPKNYDDTLRTSELMDWFESLE